MTGAGALQMMVDMRDWTLQDDFLGNCETNRPVRRLGGCNFDACVRRGTNEE